MKTILAVFLLFIAASSYALEIVTLDGKAFHDCEVKKVEREGVRIVHRDGTAFLDFDVLPSALQKQYGWTPEKSAARKAEKTAAADAQRIAGENARRAQEEKAASVAKVEAQEKERVRAEQQRKAEEQEARLSERRNDERMGEIRRYVIWGIVAFIVIYPCYWLFMIPARLAKGKSNYNAVCIMMVCGLLVLPGVGWLIALYMALQPEPKASVTHVTIIQAPPPQPRPVVVPRVVAKAIPPPRNPPPV